MRAKSSKQHCPALCDVFVSQLNPDTSESDMTYFVKLQFPQDTNVTCTKLKTKFDSYSSFRIMLNGINFKDSLKLNPESWPSGVLIKRFYSLAHLKNQASSSSNSDDTEAEKFTGRVEKILTGSISGMYH